MLVTQDSKDLKSVLLFILISFCAMYAISSYASLNGGLKSSFTLSLAVLVMFVPSMASIIAIKFVSHEELKSFGLTRGKSLYYLWAILYPFVVISVGLLFVALLGSAEIDFGNIRSFFPELPEDLKEQFWTILGVNLLMAPFINFVPAFGEEYGWRGFLLSKLVKRLGLYEGIIFTGIVWGLWHSPLILNGYNYPHHPDIMGVTVFTLWCVLVGFFLSWLRIKSESVFPAAFAHGAINAYVGFGLIVAPSTDEIMTIPFGIPGILALLVLDVIFILDLSRTQHTTIRDSLSEVDTSTT